MVTWHPRVRSGRHVFITWAVPSNAGKPPRAFLLVVSCTHGVKLIWVCERSKWTEKVQAFQQNLQFSFKKLIKIHNQTFEVQNLQNFKIFKMFSPPPSSRLPPLTLLPGPVHEVELLVVVVPLLHLRRHLGAPRSDEQRRDEHDDGAANHRCDESDTKSHAYERKVVCKWATRNRCGCW